MGRHHRKDNYGSKSKKRDSRDFGLADTLNSVKRRRTSEDDLHSSSSSRTRSETLDALNNGDGWQTVPTKSRQKHERRHRRSSDRKDTYPRLSFDQKPSKPVMIEQIRDMALYVLGDGLAPTWVAINNSRAISKVAVMMLPGFDKVMMDRARDLLATIRKLHKRKLSAQSKQQQNSVGTIENIGEDSDVMESESNLVKPNDQYAKIDWDDIDEYFDLVELYRNNWLFQDILAVRAPGDAKFSKVHSPLQAMLMAPAADNTERKGNRNASDNQFKSVTTPITHFIHTSDDLREAEYPIHPATFTSATDAALEAARRESTEQSKTAGWLDSEVQESKPVIPPASLANPRHPLSQGLEIYAVDCEMVLTSDQKSSLARISVVSWPHGKVVMDRYVKPTLPIDNYFTQYSGITPEILKNVTTTLSDVQQELYKLLTSSTVLLGHSFESDLNALKMTHPFIIDTSMLFPHPRGLPLRSSLKFLANKYLKREIQTGGADGHNSVEDARAVLDLVKLKCEKGPKYGTTQAHGEPVFKRISKFPERGGKPLTSAIVEYGSSPERGLGKDATYAIGCQDDAEVTSGLLRAINGDEDGKEIPAGGANFVWGRLRNLEFARGWVTNTNANASSLPPPSTKDTNKDDSVQTDSREEKEPLQETIDKALLKTLRRIGMIRQALPPTSLLMLCSGTSDVRPVIRLQAIQAQYRKEFKVKKWDELSVRWTDTEEQALRNAAEQARQGWGWIGVV